MSLSTQSLKMVMVTYGDEQYCLNIDHVASIERVSEITAMPDLPAEILGVIHLRGNIIPIIDFGQLIGTEKITVTDHSRIVVLQNEQGFIGLLTEAATDVIDLQTEAIQSPGISQNEESIIQGVAKHKEQLIMVLNCPFIFKKTNA
ncbi:chemotaxis protein CheW [Fictibacillus barbaricus]|uniref:Purine-binding chemotaxis protein CheW n=1 Tax=Fictibacillus barbaricus TaxID=182136 RepID=A0ABU1TVQ1_9BACL|nr:chemotaxis protein CheW [Fictibacillus barbaricus]MDR7071294.1 purine-binding chemotaxis protein CheW [Fictibacillus barbaricus]